MSVQLNLSSVLNPNQMASTLVEKNGLDRACEIAMEGTINANKKGDYYRLSIWREVKSLLQKWKLPEDAISTPDK